MAFRSSASAFSAGGAITATPAGVLADDYLASSYLTDSATANINLPAGFTQRALVTITLDGSRHFYADKDDAAGGGSDSFQFSDTAGNANALICSAWSGRDNAAPRSTSPVTTGDNNANTTPVSATINGIVASAGDDVAIFLGNDQNVGVARWTYSTISGYTEKVDGVAQDWVSGAALQTQENVTGGSTGNFAVTITRNAGTGETGYSGIVVAIKAAAAAAVAERGLPDSRIYYTKPFGAGGLRA